LAGLPLPRDSEGRIVLAVDVSNWLRPDAVLGVSDLEDGGATRGGDGLSLVGYAR
jgi:hypothetical protein